MAIGSFSHSESHLLCTSKDFPRPINYSGLAKILVVIFSSSSSEIKVFRASEQSALLLSKPTEKYSFPCSEDCDLKRPIH